MPRSTPQQSAIANVLHKSGRPLSPGEVLAGARGAVPGLSLATVYRALKRLQEDGEIARVEIPGQPPRYESKAAAAHHHHHFVCRVCDRVFDIEGCAAGLESLGPAGFVVESHEVVLYGLCRSCTKG